MSQLMNQGTVTIPAEAQPKRRRGRPRKDESQAPPRPPVPRFPSIQGEGSSTLKPTASIPSKGKESIEDIDDDDDDDQEYDEMVGQVVTGVLEYAFDAGYFLSVRVGDSNVYMRGVVFKEECIVPVTPENDIAPNTKMHKRKDFPIPSMNVIPQVAEQTARNSSLNPAENIEIQQQEKIPSPSVTQKGQSEDKEQQEKASDDKEQEKASEDKEQQEKASEDKGQQEKASDDKEQQDNLSDDKEQQEKLSLGAEIIEEVSAKMESLKDLSEPPVKRQKTDETTVSLSKEEDIIQHDADVTNENSEDAVKPVEEANNTVLLKEANISPPQIAISLKDSSVDAPTVMEQDICTTSGFQISMENPDDEDELSEPPNDISPMETEKGGDE
ncbi:FK506-binding protein 5-like [Chenopodium quinoa]|uniref:FK506-binding protein 5-like n=1 Tax=Chenopodium quinoa TaxID=63459 RepID=UPI000B78590B|nr:FK506-binding protein 5-like [Chenopodium quinoa]